MNIVAVEDAIESFLNSISLEKIEFRTNVSSQKYTTIASGGMFKAFIEPDSVVEVERILSLACNYGVKINFLGAGSNLLVSDQGIQNSIVLKLGKGFRYYRFLEYNSQSSVFVQVGASMPLMSLSRELSMKGYAGLEFAGGIPATLGGAIKMNAGAHGGEMKSVVRSVTVVLQNGECKKIQANELNFSYRHSELPKESVVVDATLELKIANVDEVEGRRATNLKYRKDTQPLTQPSFGSVFKNPSSDLSAGKLIEDVGLKGFRTGGAEFSEKHANWIVNPNRTASINDILSLIQIAQDRVYNNSGIVLTPEVVKWQS
jgi:UDP-N-acetylmuramate dehydrogenase